MHSECVNPLTDSSWDGLVGKYGEATIFHTAQWARVLSECYGYEPRYFVLRHAESIVGIVPVMEVNSWWTGRRGICLPFSDECAPLLQSCEKMPDSLLQPLREFGLQQRWDYLEIRGGVGDLPSAKACARFVSHHIRLDGAEESRLRSAVGRNIQKAEREGVDVRHLKTSDAMNIFYSLHCQTRRRHGVPPQPKKFFDLIQRVLLERDLGFVSLAFLRGKPVAGAVYLQFGSQAVYKFGASDPAFQSARANNLVMWRAVRELSRRGAAVLSLGRSDLTNEGLLQFKRGWGGQESSLTYHRIPLCKKTVQSANSPEGSVLNSVMQYLPIPVLKWIGGIMYRHVA
jgi:hypothetical protein